MNLHPPHFFRRKTARILPVDTDQPHRFISRDGRINIMKKGLSRHQPIDWGHYFLTVPWPLLLVWASLGYIALNGLFAVLYMLSSDWPDDYNVLAFLNALFFSVRVFSTLGVDHAGPLSLYANILISIESFVGWCSYGIIIGLLFSRFSHAHSPAIFSHYATIALYEGKPTLQIRIANKRGTTILQAESRLTLSRNETTLEGEQTRRVYDLPIIRSKLSLFNLTWTLRHVIDSNSPLYGETPENLREKETELVVLLSGVDETFGQQIHTHFAYNHEEIAFGSKFKSMFRRAEDRQPVIDFSLFDEIEPAPMDEQV
ncbi:MAG: ATP-sensitive inward rectifier potassium channel 10 [Proteobacteria bacterium]|jgi:inward rectifier potassium channel|nr:ATP-sensitive inward rectifier potassium channel 10 [Alphaproteobacteria bacterium]NCC03616.1 ATP-sensitive inward rectifier potassium channel 10 [Pseudomonadota bacterium]